MEDKFIYAFNVKCAKFLGMEQTKNDPELFWDYDSTENRKIRVIDMKFYFSWDWLMKVVEKILDIEITNDARVQDDFFWLRRRMAESIGRVDMEKSVVTIDKLLDLISENNSSNMLA